MGFGGLLRTGFNAFRSGGLRRGLKFARGAGKRGIKQLRQFRKKKFNSFSPQNQKDLLRGRDGLRKVGTAAKKFGRRALDSGRSGFNQARSRVGQIGRRRRQAGLRGF